MSQQNNNKESNQRLFERFQLKGTFITDDTNYEIQDISIGGMKIDKQIPKKTKGDVVNGRIGITYGELKLYTNAICEVLHIDAVNETRLKYIDIPEDFIEFLRSVLLRTNERSDYKGSSLGSETYQINTGQEQKKSFNPFRYLIRVEVLAGLAVILLTGVLLMRSTSEQNYWVVTSHEIISPVTAKISWLQTNYPLETGQQIATLDVNTINGNNINIPLNASIKSETVSWRFNIGDNVKIGDILGIVTNVPVNHDNIQAIIGFQSPFTSFKVGDDVILTSALGGSLVGQVLYSINPRQASIVTGLSADSFRFEEYYLVEIRTESSKTTEGLPHINHFGTILAKLRQSLSQRAK